ncbi:PREDICTED: delta-1-pyrroline-5-carboxylate dehydrogenase, mitochondrial [Myotis brandtii]|uniref:delta-1-pyrroline-5-carboxylate dehydrogenase, mitochondrial n=1 Tax=Myotis brandtii TaxID=109478 RepID=UPI0007047C62|nr:PREDICTED: delta-1-pyrroline-5-carboxylate dehydrogenase, mitochondrial [Myotis brandtii]
MRIREGPVQWFEANHMESASCRRDRKNDQGDWITANKLGGGGGEGKWVWRHRLRWKHASSLKVANEPVLAFTKGSPERDALQKALKDLKGRTEAIPCVVGDEEVWTSNVQYQVSPFNHGHKVAKFCYADKTLTWGEWGWWILEGWVREIGDIVDAATSLPALASRLRWKHASSLKVANEPVLAFTKGSPERDALQKALKDLKGRTEAIPCVVGDEEVWTSNVQYQVSPFNHGHKVAKFCYADKALLNKAIEAALAARKEWDLKPVTDQAQIFLKAADMLSGPRRAEVLAKTMVGQGKTVIQAEIDAAAELIDFFRFNAKFAVELEGEQPIRVPPSTNSVVYRGLEGFVAAISPFNFTAIGGNLAGAPALMGNVVLWKPSDTAMLASYAVYRILREAGLPPNIIQFVPADGPTFGDTITSSEHLCGINFTGSVPTFKNLWKQVAQNLDRYRTFPRLAGECGGKNFHFVHRSADVDSVVSGTLRSAFEYSGQKCSACSRLYVPHSLWPQIKQRLLEEHSRIKVGDPAEDFGTFFSAVIDAKSFGRIKKWLDHARSSPSLTVLAGGKWDNSVGYFVEPCIVESKDPQEPIMKEEIFGPVLTVYVYPDDKYRETLRLVDSTTSYGLTGAVFAQDKDVVREATEMLRNAAGNFYINDKSTGSVVGQQPFGGARASGTNDKPGGPHYILRWTSPQVIKETHKPLGDWRYSYMQ